VLHLVYCKVLDGRARFAGNSTFKTWLFGVIKRTAREQARFTWLRLVRLERWWERTAGRDAVPDEHEQEGDDRVEELREALGRVSPRQQEVLHLVLYQELTIQEAAEVLGIPVGTARTHYERGKSRLRQLLLASEER
jgi:RNA polymerase sigma-70 factor (ECF subfamily)